MSQAGISGFGTLPAIFTITTDSGTATPTGGNVNLYADTTVNNGTVRFTATGNTIQLHVTDVGRNTSLGLDSFASRTNGTDNSCIGWEAGRLLTSGDFNDCVGSNSLSSATTADRNSAIGSNALALLVSGTQNVAIGRAAGLAYTTNESNNICIGYITNGTIGDNNTLRIGSGTGTGAGQLNRAFIQGIVGVTTVNSQGVTINTLTGQLGAFPLGGTMSTTIINTGDSPYTVLDTDVCILVDSTLGPVSVLLPNTPFAGRVFFIKDEEGTAAANNITVTTVGGAIIIDAAASFVMNTNYQSVQVVYSPNGKYSII